MKKHNELHDIFSDNQLEPNPTFVRDLREKLTHKRSFGVNRLWLGLASGFAVLLVVVSVISTRPSHAPSNSQSNTIAKRVLLKELYSKAMSAEPIADKNITFWDVTDTQEFGPQAKQCDNFQGDEGSTGSSHMALFKKDNISALYIYGGWAEGRPIMEYSEDPDVIAFDPDTVSGEQSGQVRGMLVGAVITDDKGNPLPENADTAEKKTGLYDIYAKLVTKKEDAKNYVEGCSTLMIHIQIDAISGMYTTMQTYNGEIAPDKLSFSYKQDVRTDTGDFATILPQLQAKGFNLEQAKQNSVHNDAVNVVNKAAGYGFYYHKGLLGKPTLKEEKNSAGETTMYVYSFPKHPEIVFQIRTSKATDIEPKGIVELRANAAKNNWKISNDSVDDGVTMPGYPAGTTVYFVAEDAKTKYVMNVTGTPDVPVVYMEAPAELGRYTYQDPYAPNFPSDVDDVSSMASVMVFKPGAEPPNPL